MKPRLLAVAAALVFAPSALAAPRVDARAFVVADGATGEILLAKEPRRKLPIASITKLMTVLLALERTRLGELATVEADATSIGGSSIHLRAGEQITVRDLIEAALIQSANDAAEALADHVSRGDEGAFVSLMNARARSLRLADTHFVRPDGFDVFGHYSSARDATTLARVVMRSPFVRRIVATRTGTIAGGRSLHTWNDLLGSFPGLVGVKTGHTTGAGWCQVAAARGAGVTVYATILGSSTRAGRNADLAELLRWGLSRYRIGTLISRTRVYSRVKVPYGRGPLRLVASRRVRRGVRIDRPLVERIVAPPVVSLPVRRGQHFGEVRVYDRGRLLARSPLVAAESIAKPDVAGRVGWYASRAARNLGGWFS